MKTEKEVRKAEKKDLGNDVLIESKMGATVFAAIDLSLEMDQKQPPHRSIQKTLQ